MQDQPQIYIHFGNPHQLRQSLQQQSPQAAQSRFSDDSLFVSPDEPIDEWLLSKTSQLHESLRNQKLLYFEFLQAEIMKKQAFIKSRAIEEDLISMQIMQKNLQKRNRQEQQQLSRLQEEINNQRRLNQELLQSMQDIRRKVAKTRQEKGKIEKNSCLYLAPKQSKKIKEHGYVSIEAIRLEAQNQSKKELIHQLKAVINEVKANLTRKQSISCKLEEEYQSLLKQIRQQEKRQKCTQQNNKVKRQEEIFLNEATEKQSISYAQADKENDINMQNLCSNQSALNSKVKYTSVKLISEATVNKARGPSTSCLKNWFETGKKQLSKKIY